jgi:hypothetical protein
MRRAMEKNPGRAAVVRSMRDLELLFRPPPDPDAVRRTAKVLPAFRRQVDQETRQTKSTAASGKPQLGQQ